MTDQSCSHHSKAINKFHIYVSILLHNSFFQSWVGRCPYEEFDHQDCCSDHCFLVDISVGNPVLKIPLHLAVKKDNLTSV